MKIFSVALVMLGLGLAGCESLSDATAGLREKLANRDQPRSHTFPAGTREVYEAARVALERMDFRFLRGGPAQGEIEAIDGVGSGEVLRSSRQIAMTVRLSGATSTGGGTEVNLWLREIIEDNSSQNAGRATETPLRGTALYEAFFRNLQQALALQKPPAGR